MLLPIDGLNHLGHGGAGLNLQHLQHAPGFPMGTLRTFACRALGWFFAMAVEDARSAAPTTQSKAIRFARRRIAMRARAQDEQRSFPD
ncbi:hypothetical protein [Sandarakinorhabdus oryzae]|uniref:hypothetical protein n=1 Tax=Sandarakinorhabdus oryzae TaxID=2675220 RepID=UPI0012E32274|nr:hypothetical protein [Sandarakinorhabdus oryzae]